MSYLGTQPNDVKKNTGLYTPSEILQLTKDGSWGGSLEFIAEQTISSGSTMAFTSIKESVYDVHFIQGFNIVSSSANTGVNIRLSNDGGSSYENSNYRFATYYLGAIGNGEYKQTSFSTLPFTSDTANANKQATAYFYNLGNASKFSFHNFKSVDNPYYFCGGGVYPVAEKIDAIQFLSNNGNAWTGTIKIFGMKQIWVI